MIYMIPDVVSDVIDTDTICYHMAIVVDRPNLCILIPTICAVIHFYMFIVYVTFTLPGYLILYLVLHIYRLR